MNYSNFLEGKSYSHQASGFSWDGCNTMLFDFQRACVNWAVRLGRAALFADCGLGKSFMQIEWARAMYEAYGKPVLIVAPMSVGHQTIAEGLKLGVVITRAAAPTADPIQITNYERLHLFESSTDRYCAIVLDESSILKSLDGKTRTKLISEFTKIPFRLCCTATPAPNDVAELANHAEFLGVMSRAEMLATFFVHESDDLTWRLKNHATEHFWRWMTSWSIFLRRPSDIGFSDEGWALPELSIEDDVVRTGLDIGISGIVNRSSARRATLSARVSRAAEIIQASTDQWLVWCGLNDEGQALKQILGEAAALIEGSDNEQKRTRLESDWRAGSIKTMITKPSIFGFGMNWQHCNRQLFLGLGDSYEQYYQSIRRSYRFGQLRPVSVYLVVSDVEEAVATNVKRKEKEAEEMAENIVSIMKKDQTCAVRSGREDVYETEKAEGEGWTVMLGDACERIAEVPTDSVGFSIYSPPFASLYVYSASRRDLGNSSDYSQFFDHYAYLIPEVLRTTMPGRRTAVHCAQVSTTKATHGVIGWRDFRGDLIRAYVAGGWIYDGEICIDKNPQAQAIRTRSKQLMFVQKEKDSSWLRPAMADYILLFRKPGDNPIPIKTDVTNEEWILFAHPIWYGIRESDVLRYRDARGEDDEKHICPLQLETIERAVRLWSNPGEIVLSPFAGIGSEGYVSRRFGRKFIGIELKKSYYEIAVKHLKQADAEGLRSPTVPVDLPAKRAKDQAGG